MEVQEQHLKSRDDPLCSDLASPVLTRAKILPISCKTIQSCFLGTVNMFLYKQFINKLKNPFINEFGGISMVILETKQEQ